MNVRRLHQLTYLLAAILTMAVGASCVEPLDKPEPGQTGRCELTLRIGLPSSEMMTKTDPVALTPDENKLYDIRVWAFLHTDNPQASDLPVGYAARTSTTGEAGGDLTMVFPTSVEKHLDNDPAVRVDVYALANAASVDCSLEGMGVSRGDIQAAIIDDGKGAGFGNGDKMVSSVPATGLPMTACQNVDVTFLKYGFSDVQIRYVKNHDGEALPDACPKEGDDDIFSATQWQYITGTLCAGGTWDYSKVRPMVGLQRAVAKVRFVFAQYVKMNPEPYTAINSISLVNKPKNAEEGGILLPSTYLFPREDGEFANPSQAAAYSPFVWRGDATGTGTYKPLIPNSVLVDNLIDNPMSLRRESEIENEAGVAPIDMTLSAYDAFLTDSIQAGKAVERVVYLRETDQPFLHARINYRLGDEDDKVADIAIPTWRPDPANPDREEPYKLYRNRLWIVYAYFSTLQQRLEIEAVVLPWEGKVIQSVEALETVNVDQDGKFFVDPSLLGSGYMDTVMRSNGLKVDYYKVHVPERGSDPQNPRHAQGRIAIYGPEGGYLVVTPQGDTDAFELELEARNGTEKLKASATQGMVIDRTRDKGRIFVNVYRSPDSAKAVEGKTISLGFSVRLPDGRVINADSEVIDDRFKFVINNSNNGTVIYP